MKDVPKLPEALDRIQHATRQIADKAREFGPLGRRGISRTTSVAVFVQRIREADELERRVQLEALAVAFPLTALLFMTLGLMQIAVPLSPDNWSYRHTWPLIYVFYFVGLMAARRRYL